MDAAYGILHALDGLKTDKEIIDALTIAAIASGAK